MACRGYFGSTFLFKLSYTDTVHAPQCGLSRLLRLHLSLQVVLYGHCPCASAPAGSPSRGGDTAVHVFDINQPSLPTPFYSVFVSFFVRSVFHSINPPDNSLLSHSVLPVLFLLYGPFNCLSLYESLPSPPPPPPWGAADAEIKVPSGENTELKSPFSL